MTRKSRHKAVLLDAPYHAPSLRVGDKATCHFREGDVIVTGWTAASIWWPRCPAHPNGQGGQSKRLESTHGNILLKDPK
jgi:hypothetical protein